MNYRCVEKHGNPSSDPFSKVHILLSFQLHGQMPIKETIPQQSMPLIKSFLRCENIIPDLLDT